MRNKPFHKYREVLENFQLEVSKGKIEKHSRFNGYGERQNIAVVTNGEDVWQDSASSIPIPNQTTGESLSIVSSSANDISGGTGVRTLHIHYLDVNWTKQEEEITMNGLTPVNLSIVNVKYIQEMHSTTIGSNGVAVGDVIVYKTGSPTVIYKIIKAGGNYSLSSDRMIPANHSYYLFSWHCSSTNNKTMFVRLRSTDHMNSLYPNVFVFKDTATVQDSVYTRNFEFPIKIPAKSIIKVTVWTTQAGGNVAISYEGVLVDES